MSENERFTVKPQDDLFAVVDNNSIDKVCVVNGIRTEIETEWLCELLNELYEENEQLKSENERLQHFESLYRQKTLQLEKKYNRIIDLINEKIRETENDLNCSVKAGMPTSAMYSEIELLEELRKEFKDE